MISIFSTSLENTGFLVPRTFPATAVVFTEPTATTQRRKSSSSQASFGKNSDSCPRPIIPLGEKLDFSQQKFSPVFEIVLSPILLFQSKLGLIKAQIFDFLRLQCLIPTLIKPFKPFLVYVRCLLGLNNESSVRVPSCSSLPCTKSETEARPITHHLEAPLDSDFTKIRVRTMADCFPELQKVQYGSRILTKLVNDESCEDSRYISLCNTLLTQDRVILADSCNTER